MKANIVDKLSSVANSLIEEEILHLHCIYESVNERIKEAERKYGGEKLTKKQIYEKNLINKFNLGEEVIVLNARNTEFYKRKGIVISYENSYYTVKTIRGEVKLKESEIKKARKN